VADEGRSSISILLPTTQFAPQKELPYPLLSDRKRVLIGALGAADGAKTKRSHFIFEKGGKLLDKKVPVKPADRCDPALRGRGGLRTNLCCALQSEARDGVRQDAYLLVKLRRERPVVVLTRMLCSAVEDFSFRYPLSPDTSTSRCFPPLDGVCVVFMVPYRYASLES
jgi:hypothetical protein